MTTYEETVAANTRKGVCRNCGDQVTSKFKGRWCSDTHGDICFKAHEDRNGAYGAININRIHAVNKEDIS